MKKKVTIIFTLLILLMSVLSIKQIYVNKQKKTPKEELKIEKNLPQDLVQYNLIDEEINEDFLNWIQINYGKEVLKNLKIKLDNNEYDLSDWHDLTGKSLIVLKDLYNNRYENQSNVKVIDISKDEITLSFIGDVSLADNFEIIPYYDSRNQGINGILSEDVVKLLNEADLLIANNEFTISDRGTPMQNKIYTFRADPSRMNIYNEMGVDLVTLANNHVFDFGQDAFMDTLDTLKQNNMPYVGAGKDIDEARDPFYFIINGYKIGFVNATRAEKYILTPEAKENTPGVFRTYDPTMFKETIKETKSQSDYVIALIHWGKEDSHNLEDVQINTGKDYIDAGADILVGTHAHVLQGIEFYKDKTIVYNIGDFIFNRETKETGIFNMKITKEGNLSYEFIPCMQHNFKTTLSTNEQKQKTLNNMQNWSINATFDVNGKITESK